MAHGRYDLTEFEWNVIKPLLPNKAREHFFCNDPELNNRSIVRLAREGLMRCHPGNFGSFPGAELHRFLATTTGEVMEFSSEPV